jgi:hypothetical protein
LGGGTPGGCVWEDIERRGVVIIPPSIFTLALSLRRYRDFSRSLLRRLIPTAGDLGIFHYALVMLSLCCGWGASPPVGLLSVASGVGGRTPP